MPVGEAFPVRYTEGVISFDGGEIFISSSKHKEIALLLKDKPLQKGAAFGENRYGDKLYTLFLEGQPLLLTLLDKGLVSYSEEGIEASCLPLLKKALAKGSGDSFSPFDKSLSDKIGEMVSIKGRVHSVREVKSGAIYINFAYDFKTSVSAYIPRGAVDAIFLKGLANKEIIIKGKLTKQSGLSIKIDSPSQIIVLE
jgi:hypothetical protein